MSTVVARDEQRAAQLDSEAQVVDELDAFRSDDVHALEGLEGQGELQFSRARSSPTETHGGQGQPERPDAGQGAGRTYCKIMPRP